MEDNGFSSDIVHHDVADIEGFCLAASAQSALETQTYVSTAEGVVPHHDASDATSNLATQHKTTVCVVHGVVHHYHILASSNAVVFRRLVALQADTVIAYADSIVYDECLMTVAQVDAVSILRVPFRTDSDAIDDDVNESEAHSEW